MSERELHHGCSVDLQLKALSLSEYYIKSNIHCRFFKLCSHLLLSLSEEPAKKNVASHSLTMSSKTTTMASGAPLRVFIFDGTRLRSHLFFRYFSTHPDVSPIYHPFLTAAMFGPEQLAQHLKHSDMRKHELEVDMVPLQVPDTYASNRAAFEAAVAKAEEAGKVPISNEHWFNVFREQVVLDLIRDKIKEPNELGRNPTHLPDEFFDTLTPIILIRHPALAVRSIYRDALKVTKQRPGDEDFSLITENKSLRLLFDYFKAQGRQPAVVDAEDILWRTDDMTKNLFAKLGGGLDPKKLNDSWNPATKEEIENLNPLVYMLTKDIQESSGIQRPEKQVTPPIS